MKLEDAHIHIMGIGGAGMSAIARVLHARGAMVSGCDGKASPVLAALDAEGIKTYVGHDAAHLAGVNALAPSSAIGKNDAEVAGARERHIPVWHRGDLLGALMQDKVGIAVAGTHGKSTTTSMIATILMDADLDPSFIIGATPTNLGTNARHGEGEAFVVEADEYDRTFLRLQPKVAVITNIEFDHPDIYKDYDDTLKTFIQFTQLLPDDGLLVVCEDDKGCGELVRKTTEDGGRKTEGAEAVFGLRSPVITYGIHRGQWRATNLRANPLGGMDFTVTGPGQSGEVHGVVSLRVPGEHNVQNALAALAVADACGVPLDTAIEALGAFRGADRRFELKGEARGVRVFDDYAHNPTKIRATLHGARLRYPVGNIWAIWQPHTYSRTIALMDDFATAFAEADQVVVLPIYAAREKAEDFGFAATALNPIEISRKIKHKSVRNAASFGDALGILISQVRAGDVVITLSAGDGNLVGQRLLEMLK